MVQARERARELARADLEREERLVELATEFFASWDEVEQAEENLSAEIERLEKDLARKIEQARERSEVKTLKARRTSAKSARAMIEAGLSQRKVSERLGLSPAALRSLLEQTETAGEPAESGEVAPPGDLTASTVDLEKGELAG